MDLSTNKKVTLYLDPELYKQIAEYAFNDGRSVNGQIVFMLRRGLSIDDLHAIEGFIKRRKDER